MSWPVVFLISFLGLWAVGFLFTFLLQDLFIFRPIKLKQDHQFSFELEYSEHFLESESNGKINLLFFRDETKKRKLILYLHGNSGNLQKWGELCQFFNEYDHDFLTYDYRGFGKSKGKRTESLFHEDAQHVYDFALNYYSPQNIIIFGRSMGSGPACKLAANNPHRLLILETPYYSIIDLFKTYYPFIPVSLLRFKYEFRNDLEVQKISGPIYIFQGKNDYVVPYRCAVKLKQHFQHPESEFIYFPTGTHSNLSEFKQYHQKISEIFDR
ncbi:MAG: alpha/beta fold hydrolase [Bacteroidetes bacterium]|nr:MAG: alpha/beta fold hydrolase [Bacteroidota bacterium]